MAPSLYLFREIHYIVLYKYAVCAIVKKKKQRNIANKHPTLTTALHAVDANKHLSFKSRNANERTNVASNLAIYFYFNDRKEHPIATNSSSTETAEIETKLSIS